MVAFSILFIALIWFSHRYAWWRKTVDWQQPRVLMYHMISEHRPKAQFNKLRVTPAQFEKQVKWLSEQGFTFLTMSELYLNWSKVRLQPKTVAITFDDGYADNLHQALLTLKKYSAKATIYVVVDRHDRDWSTYKKAHHNSGELTKEIKLTDAEIQQLVASGLVEIGSHTLTHANLANLNDEQRQIEFEESRRSLQTLTGQPIDSFAYPFGIYDVVDVKAAANAGYTTATTTVEGIDAYLPLPDFLELKRIKVSGRDNMLAFKCRIRTGHRGWVSTQ
jgi:peptidoglycan/xylan/chitin deacetylase (PgdA/CDA1 family)